MAKLTDPVEKDNKAREAKEIEAGVKTLSLDSLSINDLKAVPRQHAMAVHPFEGYPMEDIQIGEALNRDTKKTEPVIVKKTHLVFLSPTLQVAQDPSGRRTSITDMKTGRERRVDLKTYHSRMIRNFEEGNESNTDVVFDREYELGDGSHVMMSIVPSHSVRAQLVFEKDPKTGKTKVNQNYLLADGGQVARLRRLFDQIYSNKINAAERAAKEFEETPESAAGDV